MAEFAKPSLSTPNVSDSNPRSTTNFQKPFWIILDHIISSVHPTWSTRVISRGRSNRDRVLCQGLLTANAGNDPNDPIRGKKLYTVHMMQFKWVLSLSLLRKLFCSEFRVTLGLALVYSLLIIVYELGQNISKAHFDESIVWIRFI